MMAKFSSLYRFVLLFACWPGVLFAQEKIFTGGKTADIPVVDPLSSTYLLKLTGGLILVVMVIFLLAWMVRKMNFTQQGRSGLIQIIAGLSVGSRDRIVLIQLGEEQILLGLTPGKIEKLHTLKTPLLATSDADHDASFASKLAQIIDKSRS